MIKIITIQLSDDVNETKIFNEVVEYAGNLNSQGGYNIKVRKNWNDSPQDLPNEIILPCNDLNLSCTQCGHLCQKIDFSKYTNQGRHLYLKDPGPGSFRDPSGILPDLPGIQAQGSQPPGKWAAKNNYLNILDELLIRSRKNGFTTYEIVDYIIFKYRLEIQIILKYYINRIMAQDIPGREISQGSSPAPDICPLPYPPGRLPEDD